MAFGIEGIEFVGGPLDGYLQFLDVADSELDTCVLVPVNRNVVEVLTGSPLGIEERATSVAVYELAVMGNGPQYVHKGSAHPSQFNLSGWAR